MIISLADALEIAEDALILEGFDDCIIGIASRCGEMDLVVYDFDLIIDKLQKMGLSYDNALDHYNYNMAGSWAGEGTPLYLERIFRPTPSTQSHTNIKRRKNNGRG